MHFKWIKTLLHINDYAVIINVSALFQFYDDYGDIVEETIRKAQEINQTLTARTLSISLIQVSACISIHRTHNYSLKALIKSLESF
jgi:ureidoglycolate hydrolase